MKKVFRALLICMLVVALVATTFAIPVSAANVDEENSVGKVFEDKRVRSNDSQVTYIVVKFPDGVSFCGTGFIFAKNAIMTAAHVIYDKDHGGFAKNITVYPGGKNGQAYSAKICSFDASIIAKEFGYSWDYGRDWAILQTSVNIGDIYGYFGFTTEVKTNDTLTLTGFHSDKNFDQYSESGKPCIIDPGEFYHKISMTPGASGSPLYNKDSRKVVGVCTADSPDYNKAARITNYVYDQMLAYRQKTEYRQHYFILYKANGGSGSMDQTTVNYGYTTKLRKNTFENGGVKQFVGWTAYRTSDQKWWYENPNTGETNWYKEGSQPSGWKKAIYNDEASVAKTSSVNLDIIILYAQWKNFTIKYYAEGGSGSMDDSTVYNGTNYALKTNTFTKSHYNFKGWTAYKRFDKKWCYKNPNTGNPEWYKTNPGGWEKYVYENQQIIKNLSSVHNDVVELHAQWSPYTYTIKYKNEDGSGSMSDTKVTYGVATKLRTNTYTSTINRDGKLLAKQFAGWAAYRSSDDKWCYKNPYTGKTDWYKKDKQPTEWVYYLYEDGATIASKHSGVDKDVITLYAQWKNYTINYNNYYSGNGSMDDTKVYYGIAEPLRSNTFTRKGYNFKGWTAYRASDYKWCYKNPTTGDPDWYTEKDGTSLGLEKYIYKDKQSTAYASSTYNDTICMYAQWEKIDLNANISNTDSLLKGDVDKNGELNINDVTMLQRYLAEMIQLDDQQMKAADVDGDGEVNIKDITAMQILINNQA